MRWVDGWMSLLSDFSFVFFTLYSEEHSKPASCSGLPKYASWTMEARLDGKRYVLDCYSIRVAFDRRPTGQLSHIQSDM